MLSRITPTDSALREQAPPPSAPAGASTDATSSDTFQSCLAVIATPVITAARAQDPAPRGSAQPPPKADWRVLDAMALVVPPPGTEEASTQTPVLPAPGPLKAKATPDPATPETPRRAKSSPPSRLFLPPLRRRQRRTWPPHQPRQVPSRRLNPATPHRRPTLPGPPHPTRRPRPCRWWMRRRARMRPSPSPAACPPPPCPASCRPRRCR